MTRQDSGYDSNISDWQTGPSLSSFWRKLDKTNFAAWMAGIAGTLTVMVLLFSYLFIPTASPVAEGYRPVAENLLPTVTPTPPSIVLMGDRPQLVEVGHVPVAQATPLPYAVRARLAITQTGVLKFDSNLRAGPSADYDIVGGVEAGEVVEIADCTAQCDWYKLPGNKWVAAWLVDMAPAQIAAANANPLANSLPASATDVTWGVVTASLLNVRAGPGSDYVVLDFRSEGSCIPLLGTKGSWTRVPLSYDSAGWAAGDHIQVVPTCPSSHTSDTVAQAEESGSVETSELANQPG